MKNLIAYINQSKILTSYFAEYIHLMHKINHHLVYNPDISIETTKSLIEGISKKIIQEIDNDVEIGLIENWGAKRVYNKAISCLAINNDVFNSDLCDRFSKVYEQIINVRNDTGDISHGHVSPKLMYCTKQTASLVCNWAEALLLYWLQNVFEAFKKTDELIYENQKDFNNYLDYKNEGIPFSYSKALFDQNIDQYRAELENYEELNEHE